jgi:hypothetical protein
MTTNRRALQRDHHVPVSPEALDCWRRLRFLERMGATGSDEYKTLGKKLCSLTGLWWGDMQWPTDAIAPEVPASLRHRELQREAYKAAHAVRCALIEAESQVEAEAG